MMANTKKIKNPLRKRIFRDICKEKGKYISIFLFLTLMIAVVSGMLVASNSMIVAYDNGIEKYSLEDGHFAINNKANVSDLQKIADKTDEPVTIYEQYYYNFDYKFDGDKDYSIRIYKNRDKINTYSIFEGTEPKKGGDIAIDRLFAENNDLALGDTINIDGKELTICGLVAVPDYSCLFENNQDTMFNATVFTTGFVSDDYFKELSSSKLIYSYAYIFSDNALDDKACYNASNDLMEALNKDLMQEGNYLTDFLARQNNKAITFTREDMGSDSNSTLTMLYIMIALLAFIFALMTSSSIESEAGAIGTLRASGYTRMEIVCHYMAAPTFIFVVSAILGNILGYTCFRRYMEQMYYHSYSLPVYEVVWNAKAFLLTTVIPIAILIIINFIALYAKLKLSPLQFLRHELTNKKKKKVTKLPNFKFFTRFRLRTLLQNMPNYITMCIGIFMANILFLFSASMLPILNNNTDNVLAHLIAKYQYTLKSPADTDNEAAERYCMTSLDSENDKEILIYGISDNSQYITTIDMPENNGDVIVSKAFMEINNYKIGDKFTLHEKYGDNSYTFTIAGSYNYPAAMSVFMSIDNYNTTFDKDSDYYTGYFSDEKIDDIDDDYIYTTLTTADYTKLSDQLNDSFERTMPMMQYLSLIIFVIVIYLLSKIVLEKNAESISLTKILGYNNVEISKIYILTTAIAVILSIAITLPLSVLGIKSILGYMFTTFDIWLEVNIDTIIYVKVVLWDIICYAVLSMIQYRKIKRIPMEEALKNRE